MGGDALDETERVEHAAGAVAALIVHCITERNLGGRIREVSFLRPLHTALYEAVQEWPAEAPIRAEMLGPAGDGTAEIALAAYRAMIVEDVPPPSVTFRHALFRRLAAQPDVRILTTPSAAKPSETKLPETVLVKLATVVAKALDVFLESHCHRTYGFDQWADHVGLLTEPSQVRDQITLALSVALLGLPWIGHDPRVERTLIPWVKAGWRVHSRDTGKRVSVESVLLQALIGPYLSRIGRKAGALRQGLITEMFRSIYNLPLLTDCEVPVVTCPLSGKREECVFSLLSRSVVCSRCRQSAADGNHEVLRRRNIDVLGHVIRPGEQHGLHTSAEYPLWAEIPLALCPGERSIDTTLAVLVLQNVETNDDVQALQALAPDGSSDHTRQLVDVVRSGQAWSQKERRGLRGLGAALQKARKNVGGGKAAQLSATNGTVRKDALLAKAVERLLTIVERHAAGLRAESQHLVPNRGASCDRSFGNGLGTHGQASIRPTTVYVRVDERRDATAGDEQGEPLEVTPHTASAGLEHEMAAAIQTWRTNPTPAERIMLTMLGHDPARQVMRLLNECDTSKRTPVERLENAPTLQQMWESLPESERETFGNRGEFNELAAELVVELVQIVEQGQATGHAPESGQQPGRRKSAAQRIT